MKNLSFGFFNIVPVFLIILILVLIIVPFNLINLEQAERIAKWKSEYEQLSYCFSLVNLHEGSIVPSFEETGKLFSEDFMLKRLKPYFNVDYEKIESVKKYKYKRMNGSLMPKNSQFFFENFFIDKKGTIFSLKQNTMEIISDKQPLFFLYVDINGLEKPNRVGQDIFFISIFRNHISALGNGRPYSKLKANCSPIASGLYCSEYYLLGGRF